MCSNLFVALHDEKDKDCLRWHHVKKVHFWVVNSSEKNWWFQSYLLLQKVDFSRGVTASSLH